MLNGYILQFDRCNAFADGRITQYIHQMAFNYIAGPQQKWNIQKLTTFKLEGDTANFYLQSEKLPTTTKS